MTVTACPAALVAAPCAEVWALLADPAAYAGWWDARTERIVPPGPAQPGQTVYGHAVALGTRWPVQTAVEWVDAGRRQIRLRTSLPLGITVTNHITCVPLTDERCRVQFG